MSPIAVIPARVGSKRIPKKNIKNFLGKPILAYSIETAQKTNLFSDVIVSTDDTEIMDIALTFGATCSSLRSKELSDDFATTSQVLANVVGTLNLHKEELVCCIYPATPLLTEKQLQSGYKLMMTGKWDYVFAATPTEKNFFRSFTQDENGGVYQNFPQFEFTRTQDLPLGFVDAGQFYWGKSQAWIEERKIFSNFSTFIAGTETEFVDIDDLNDWKKAEILYMERHEK